MYYIYFFILCVSCYTEVQLKSFQTEFFNILVIINYDFYHVILIEKLHTILELFQNNFLKEAYPTLSLNTT